MPLAEVRAWMRAERPIPNRELGELLDAITEDTLRHIQVGHLGNDGSASNDP